MDNNLDSSTLRNLLSKLGATIDWFSISFINIKRLVAARFSTVNSTQISRVEIDAQGTRLYDAYNQLTINILPNGSFFGASFKSIVTKILTLSDANSRVVETLDGSGATGVFEIQLDTGEFIQFFNSQFRVKNTTSGMELDGPLQINNGRILLSTTRGIESGNTKIKWFDNGTTDKFLGFYRGGSGLIATLGLVGSVELGFDLNTYSTPLRLKRVTQSLGGGTTMPTMIDGEYLVVKDTDTGKYYSLYYDGSDGYRSSELLP